MAKKRRRNAIALPLGDDIAELVKIGFTPGLVDLFAIPPFSVLDARQGYWQDRKRLWIRLGIRSELGRGEGVLMDAAQVTTENLNYYRNRNRSHDSTPAPVGDGGLSDRLAPRPGNNLLGMSSQSEDYRKGRGTYKKGKADARAFGLDMMRGEGADRYEYVGGKDRYGHRTDQEIIKADDNVIPTGTGPAVFSDGAINPYLARSRKPAHFGAVEDTGKSAAINAPTRPASASRYRQQEDPDEDPEMAVSVMGTSIFDPVLTELMYCWFSPAGGRVLDPFAGGSVRGIVAAAVGRHYTGIDLRPEQVEANEVQWERIGPGLTGTAAWITGDARNVLDLTTGPYDFILTCPPYFDLEQYSYDPADLSNAGDYGEFIRAFRDVIERSCSLLAPDRFAAVVVGDIRDDRGYYRNFPAHTINLFQKYGGMTLYNEAVLLTSVGSLPVRVPKQFKAGRKLGKSHQNVLVFYNGDPRRIRDVLGDIAMAEHDGQTA